MGNEQEFDLKLYLLNKHNNTKYNMPLIKLYWYDTVEFNHLKKNIILMKEH